MEALSLEEILQSKSKEFVLAQVIEILDAKKSSILNRDQVILNWILNSIYKNVSKKSTLQKSKVPFIMDVRVWHIFSKVIEKRKDFSVDMALLKGIGVMCSATLPASQHISSIESQIESNAVGSKAQIIELCAGIMDKLFKFSVNYWPSVENYAIFFVSILPSILDTFHSNLNIENQLLSSVVHFLNACCVQYISLLNSSRYEKRYQSTLKFIEYLFPLYRYFSEEHDRCRIEQSMSISITDSFKQIIQDSFFPQSLHISDTTKLIEEYSSTLNGNDKNNKNLSSILINKINECIKKYHSSLSVFPTLLSSFIQFIQQYKSVVDTLSSLNLNENLESLQFMFFKELLAAISDQLLKEGKELLSIQQINVIERMLNTISKYNIYNSRNDKHIGSISNLVDSTYNALLAHSSSNVVFNILIEISNLDYSLLEPKLTTIFSLAFKSHDIKIIESVLTHFLLQYSKLRQFDKFFQTVLSSMNSIDANIFLSCYQFSQCFSKIVQEIPVGQIHTLCNTFQNECQKSWQNSRDFTVVSHLYILYLDNIPLSKANAQTIYDFIRNSYKNFISVVYIDTQTSEDTKHLVLLSLYSTFLGTIENCLNYLPYSLQDNIFNWESPEDENSLLNEYVDQYLLNRSKLSYSNSLKYMFYKLLIKKLYYLNWTGGDDINPDIYLTLLENLSSLSNISSNNIVEVPAIHLNTLQEINSISKNTSHFNLFYWKLIVDNIVILMGQHIPDNYCTLLLDIVLSNFVDHNHNTISINSINTQLLASSTFYELNKFRDIFVSVLISKLNQNIITMSNIPSDVVDCLTTLHTNTIEDFPNIINTILIQDTIMIDSAEYTSDDTITMILNIVKLVYSIPIAYFPKTDQTRILQMMFLLERIATVLPTSICLTNTLSLSRKIIYNILTSQPSLKKIVPVQSAVWFIQSQLSHISSLDLLKQSVDLLSLLLSIHSVNNMDLMKYFKKLHKETRQYLVIQQSIMSSVLQWLASNSASFRKNEDLLSSWMPYLNRVKRSLFKSIHQCDNASANISFYLESISLLLMLYNDVLCDPLSEAIKRETEEIVSGILRLPWIDIIDASVSEKQSILTFLKTMIKMKSNLARSTILQLVHIILSLLDILQKDKSMYSSLLSLFSLLLSGTNKKDNEEVISLFNYQLSIYDLKKFNVVLDCVNIILPSLKDSPSSTKFKYQLLILIMTKSMQFNYQTPQNMDSILLIVESIIKNLNVYYVDCMLANLNMTSSTLLSPNSFLIYAQILIILITEQPEYCFKCAASFILCVRSLTMKLSSIVEKAENKISCLECVARLYQIIASFSEFAEYFIYIIADYLEFVENYHFVDTNLITIQRSIFELMARVENERLDHLNTILSSSNKVNFRKLYNQFQRDFMFKPDML